MPQMSPLMWSTLFMTFSSLMALSMIKLYFNQVKQSEGQKTENYITTKTEKSWKW